MNVRFLFLLFFSGMIEGDHYGVGRVEAFSATVKSKTLSSSSSLSASLGQSIQTIRTVNEGLELASQFWLPKDENLPSHYRTQAIHHETRQRWAGQLLQKLEQVTEDSPISPVHDERFSRLVLAASIPFGGQAHDPDMIQNDKQKKKEQQALMEALQALHGLIGRAYHHRQEEEEEEEEDVPTFEDRLPAETIQGIQQLMARALAWNPTTYSLDLACELCWSIEGLQACLPSTATATANMQQLTQRTSQLPFQILRNAISWNEILPSLDTLLHAIPFSNDRIITRHGTAVQERRGTAWLVQSESGIGALAYSGKLMTPKPMPELVEQVMHRVEEKIGVLGTSFDCALCNHYADATAACKFHTDPEHGSHWDRTTVVVAAGSDRKFAFKPIPSITTWQEWDDTAPSTLQQEEASNTAAVTHLFAGDLVVMTDTCNDDFYHAVHAGRNNDPRISLVFKRAIERGGTKGHGLAGQGRRRRRRVQTTAKSTAEGNNYTNNSNSRHRQRRQSLSNTRKKKTRRS